MHVQHLPPAPNVKVGDELLAQLRVHLGELLAHALLDDLSRRLLRGRALVEVGKAAIQLVVDLAPVLLEILGIAPELLLLVLRVGGGASVWGKAPDELWRDPCGRAGKVYKGFDDCLRSVLKCAWESCLRTGLDGRDDLDRRGPGANDGDALAGQIEILRVVARVGQHAPEGVKPLDIGPLPPASAC